MKDGWIYKKLRDLCNITTGKHDANHAKEGGVYRFYTCASQYCYCDTYKYDGDCLILPGNGANVGDVYRYSGKFDAYQRTYVLDKIKKDEVDINYLYYYFLCNWRKQGTAKQYGAATNYIVMGNFTNFTVGYPPHSEQLSIVARLDAAFAHIDALKANAEKQLAEASQLFQAELAECMRQKEGWEEKMLKEIGLTQTGTTPSKADPKNYGDYIPFIRPSEIDVDGCGNIEYDSEMKLSEQGLNNGRLFKKHSILMVCIGATISKVGYCTEDVSCNQQINILTPKDGYDYKFVYYAMRNKDFKDRVIKEGTSAQATLPIINKSKWEQLSLFVPHFTDQQTIASRLDALSANIKKLEEVQRKTLAECDALKQAMLREVFE